MLPAFVRVMLRAVVPPRAAAHVIAELADDYALVRPRMSRAGAAMWLTRETLSLVAAFGRQRAALQLRRVRSALTIGRDLRLVLRGMRRRPVAACTASLMLSAGLLGALATAALAHVLLLRPVSLAHGDDLRRVSVARAQGRPRSRLSHVEFRRLHDHLSGAALTAAAALTPAVIRAGTTADQALVEVVDGDYFEAMGLRPGLGRALAASDYRPGAPPVAVISDHYWRRGLESAPLDGLTIDINGAPFTVVGIAPPASAGGFIGSTVSAWVPAEAADRLLNRGWRETLGERIFLALLLPVRPAAVEARLAGAAAALRGEFPRDWQDSLLRTEPASAMLGSQRRAAATLVAILSALALLMLVVAAANVAGILLAGAAATLRQVEIHLALGATRAAIVRRHVLEGSLIGIGAGATAAALYAWLRPAFTEITLLPTLPLRLDLPWTPALVAAVVPASALCGALLAVAPGWWTVRAARAGGGPGEVRVAGGPGLSRLRGLLVSAQVCLSLVLVVGAVLFSRSVDERAAADLGFPRDRLAAFDFDVEPAVPDAVALPSLAREALARAAAIPGVRAAAMASRAPVDASTPGVDVFPAGDEARLVHDASFTLATPGYFDAVGLPLVRGRAFVEADSAAPAVAVVNHTLAARLWPGEPALDRIFVLRSDGRKLRVIGIARDSKYRSIAEPPRPHFYLPAEPTFGLTLLVGTHGDPRRVLTPVQDALSTAGPGVVGFFPRTFEDHVAIDMLPARAAAAAARSLGVLGLVLSTAGLYGVIAWVVEMRRREIGVRMALGASSRTMARDVAMQALRTAAPGLAAGVVLAAVGGRAARSFLFGVRPLDPVAFGTAALAFAVIVVLAAWLPARRAARTDPAVALRGE